MRTVPSGLKRSRSYLIKMKSLLGSVVLISIFLARSVGAFQQNIIKAPTVTLKNKTSNTPLPRRNLATNMSPDIEVEDDDYVRPSTKSNSLSNRPSKQNNQPTMSPRSTASNPSSMRQKMPMSNMYKDGVYSADGIYDASSGRQKIGITLTISNDVIVSASATQKAIDPTSGAYEDYFIANYKQFVVGKSIKNLKLSSVSGATLTTIGFNNAVNLIRQQAL